MGAISEGTIEKLREGMAREADTREGVKQTTEIQIIVLTEDNETCVPKYQVHKKGIPLIKNGSKYWTFLELLDKYIDFFGYEERAAEYLRAALYNFSITHNCDPVDLQIRVITPDNNDYPRPVPYIYIDKKDGKGFQPAQQINFGKDIFQEA